MTPRELQLAMRELVLDGLRLPHDHFPGAYHGGHLEFATEELWNLYPWNPPAFITLEIDALASPKPTWAEIEAQVDPGQVRFLAPLLRLDLRRECRERITVAYGENTFDAEMELRLRSDTPDEDAERDRLRARYRELKDRIETGTLEELRALDLETDATWAADEL